MAVFNLFYKLLLSPFLLFSFPPLLSPTMCIPDIPDHDQLDKYCTPSLDTVTYSVVPENSRGKESIGTATDHPTLHVANNTALYIHHIGVLGQIQPSGILTHIPHRIDVHHENGVLTGCFAIY